MRTRSHARRTVAMAVALVCTGLIPDAMRGAEPVTYTLHIASQPLDSALQEFARQTGVQIIFLSSLTDGQRALALDGTYAVEAALKLLLGDSMLTFRWVNAKTIEISRLRRPIDRAK